MELTSQGTGSDISQDRGVVEGLSGRRVWWALAAVLAIVFLAYANTLQFQFVHDDRFQVLGNTWLRSWKYLPRFFTADVWAFNHPVFRGTFYRPIFLVWFRLQYLIFGLRPWGWHLCTVLCHVGVTLLAYFTAARLLKDRSAALFAALIFGLHPTHADAVAWVSGVTEPLFAIFLLASFLCYLEKRAQPNWARVYWAASLAFYVLACLSKETAVVLPLIIFACECLWSEPKAPSWWRAWTQRVRDGFLVIAPYVVLFVLYLGARLMALQSFQNTKEGHSYLSMALTWPSVLWFYLRHLLWPADLNPFYSRQFYSDLNLYHVVLPAVVVLLAGAGLWVWGKRDRRVALATVWLTVPILPALNLRAFIEGHLVHDRYLYVPSFGFAMLAALAIRRINFGKARVVGAPAVQFALVALAVLAMMVGIHRATACYVDEAAFFARVSSASPEGRASNLDLAGILGNQGHIDEAIKMYQEMWPARHDNWDVNYNLGYAYYLTGKLADAERYLGLATQLDASRPDAFFYLGLTQLKRGDLSAAAANVQRAVIIRPDADHYHFALGVIFRLQRNLPGALSEFRQEVDLDPGNVQARQQAAEVEAEMARR